MTQRFDSIDAAFMTLSDPSNPEWGEAFEFLMQHPDTSQLMIETFRDTMKQMGIEPSGLDPVTGEPTYTLKDVARAMGIPETELDLAVEESLQTQEKQ